MRSCYTARLSPTNIAIADLCDYHGRGLIITRINVPAPYRGRGHGSRLLRRITRDADATCTRLWLEVLPSGGLSHDELVAWYERHGFMSLGGIYRRLPA